MGKQERERDRRREERIRKQAEEESAARRKRVTQIVAGSALVALVAIVALILISQSGSDDGGGDAASVDGTAEVRALLSGIPQNGAVLGDPSVKQKIVEFGDLQCPVCKEFSTSVVKELIEGPVSDGTAQIEFRNWTILGPQSRLAAKAALAASLQDRYWQFVELFYRNQGTENSGYVTDDFLRSIAEGAGVPNLDKWESDRDLPRWNSILNATDTQAITFGFSGTPSFVVEGPGGTKPLGTPQSAAEIESNLSQTAGG